MKCDLCFTRFNNRTILSKHIWKFHDRENIGKVDPYTEWLSLDYCICGCSYSAENNEEMHMHLLLFHSHDELADWSINREYLKLLQGVISKKTFFKRVKSVEQFNIKG